MSKNRNLTWHEGTFDSDKRFSLLGQKGLVFWFTGLSGSGKSTIAVEVEKQLLIRGKLAYRLDGDNIRHGLNSDLGFSLADRTENIRRIAEVARLFKDAGIITLASFISPTAGIREMARTIIGDAFIEVYVKASVETCKSRDPKGLYKKALSGEIKEFTGISSPYDVPENPDLTLDTEKLSPREAADIILEYLYV